MAIDKGLKAGAQDTYEGVERATDDLAEVADAVKVSEGLARRIELHVVKLERVVGAFGGARES